MTTIIGNNALKSGELLFNGTVKFENNSNNILSKDKINLLKKVNKIYQKYSKKNWNGYGAMPINKNQKNIVREFIKKLPDKVELKAYNLYQKLQIPHIVPDPCGEIWLIWKTKDNAKKLTIAISKNGDLTYSFRNKKNKKVNIISEYNINKNTFITESLASKLNFFYKCNG